MIVGNVVSTDLELSDDTEVSKTYKLASDKIQGYVDELEALQQYIEKVLNTEQFEYPIYSLDYGIQLYDLVGKDPEYVQAELPRRITDCLTGDDRIQSVDNFRFSTDGDQMLCAFDVTSIYGTISASKGVTV